MSHHFHKLSISSPRIVNIMKLMFSIFVTRMTIMRKIGKPHSHFRPLLRTKRAFSQKPLSSLHVHYFGVNLFITPWPKPLRPPAVFFVRLGSPSRHMCCINYAKVFWSAGSCQPLNRPEVQKWTTSDGQWRSILFSLSLLTALEGVCLKHCKSKTGQAFQELEVCPKIRFNLVRLLVRWDLIHLLKEYGRLPIPCPKDKCNHTSRWTCIDDLKHLASIAII